MPMALKLGLNFLIEDELDVLVPAKAECHDKDPGLAEPATQWVQQHRPRAKVDLSSLGDLEVKNHRSFRWPGLRRQEALYGLITSGKTMVTLELGENCSA
jgi:hypothetical protein